MEDEDNRILIRDIVNSRFRLPNLKWIRVDNIPDEENVLANFFKKCSPSKLKLLLLNKIPVTHTPIKAKFYINSLLKIVNITTKEVCIKLFEFNEEELQLIIKASSNTEKIKFYFCSIHCSTKLDFGAKIKYNTKHLSFQCWGSIRWKEWTTDWKFHSPVFANIIDAIGNSGLRYSLKNINIGHNRTLSKTAVQRLLNDRDMAHIL